MGGGKGYFKWDCGLHPLIHTFLKFNLAQDVEKKKTEPKTPHFFRLNRDIVAGAQKGKCRLKYVIHSPSLTGALKKRSRDSTWSLKNE